MKRILPALLVLLMILSIAGCADSSDEPSGQPTSGPSETTVPESQETSAEPVSKDVKLPITDTPVTFSIWTSGDVSGAGIVSNADNYAWKEMEQRTNVHIEWTHAASGMADEQFNLSLQSGDYYDSYWNATWPGSFDYFIENEVILDITDLVQKYAPNYDEVRRVDEISYKITITDTGKNPGFYEVSQSKQWPFVGPVIRKDFLDSIGKSVPQTYDQLYEVLVAFRDELNIEIPLALDNTGADDWLMVGKNVTYGNTYFNAQFYQVNGKVKFGPLEDEFKDYLRMVNKWYSEGLIDRDFYSRDTFSVPSLDQAYICNDRVGAGRTMYTFLGFLKLFATNENFKLVGMPAPVQKEGDKINLMFGGGSLSYIKGSPNVITTACEDPVTMTKWFDYFYTEEGALLLNYGIKDLSFYYAEDGKPSLSEIVTNDSDGRDLNAMCAIYTGGGSGGPWWYDWRREIRVPGIAQEVLDTEGAWTGNMADNLYSFASLSVTEEETSRFNAVMSDVNTYLTEMIVKFILGDKDIDKEWDSYIRQLKSMGIDEAIKMQQDAYDRFVNRSE